MNEERNYFKDSVFLIRILIVEGSEILLGEQLSDLSYISTRNLHNFQFQGSKVSSALMVGFAAMVIGDNVKLAKKKKLTPAKKKKKLTPAKKMKIERKLSAWSNPPDDILWLIMNRLYNFDQIRLRAVCKGWREANNIPGILKSADKLPWSMAIDSNSCHLYDPSHKQKYTIETSNTRTGIFINAKVLALKHGWVLFAKTEHADFILTNAKFFFYSPFTNQIIQLPDFQIMFDDKATFTTSPDSPDCEIFIVRKRYRTLTICTCSPGDMRWTKLTKFSFYMFIVDDEDNYATPHNIEYVDGVLYCSFKQIAVAAFNTALKTKKIFSYPTTETDHILFDYLIEYDGNLLLCHGLLCHGSKEYSVFRLDRSQMNWIRVHNLDNRSLFLNDYTPLFIPTDETSELVNTVHSEKCFHSSVCPKISQYYDWEYKHLQNFWIQLPQLR